MKKYLQVLPLILTSFSVGAFSVMEATYLFIVGKDDIALLLLAPFWVSLCWMLAEIRLITTLLENKKP